MRTNTSNRLKQIMGNRQLKQIDILQKTLPLQKQLGIKMSKSALSQYVNGIRLPDQDRIYLLSKALDVNEGWLMGFDVPMERIPDEQRKATKTDFSIETIYKKLEPPRQKKVYKFAEKQLKKQNEIPNITDREEEKYTVSVNGLLTAGHGSINFDKEQPVKTVTLEYVPRKYDLAFEISGDSMFPTFQDGEIVFVQRLQAIYNGMLAAIEINNEAFIKKVYLDDNRIRLVSLNTDLNDSGERLYPDFYADEKDDIHMIGRVLT